MNISINLLPESLKESHKKQVKKNLIMKISMGLLIFMIIITSILLTFVFLDNLKIQQEKKQLDDVKKRVASFKEQESLAAVLKNRLSSINGLVQKSSPQEITLDLILKLIPENLRVLSLSIDKANRLKITAETGSTKILDEFFTNLSDPKIHDGKIASTKIESLSKTQNNQLHFELSIKVN